MKRDESGVATADLLALMEDLGMPSSMKELSDKSGVNYKVLSRIMGTKKKGPQPFTGLKHADQILLAMGGPMALQDITIIPNSKWTDAYAMASYEFMDEYDNLQGSREEIEDRADELMQLRRDKLGEV